MCVPGLQRALTSARSTRPAVPPPSSHRASITRATSRLMHHPVDPNTSRACGDHRSGERLHARNSQVTYPRHASQHCKQLHRRVPQAKGGSYLKHQLQLIGALLCQHLMLLLARPCPGAHNAARKCQVAPLVDPAPHPGASRGRRTRTELSANASSFGRGPQGQPPLRTRGSLSTAPHHA